MVRSMAFSEKFIRAQLNILKPIITGCSLEAARKSQDAVGALMAAEYRREVSFRSHAFSAFEGAWALPKDETRQGVILYLHGGGYTCGDLEYAKGFGAMLAASCGLKVFCAAYRLAPESRFPAAIDDAMEAYRYLLRRGYNGNRIVLCGESAGGGLLYALCLRLKKEGLPLPCGLIAISPWTDLAATGQSYTDNRDVDPSMTQERLAFFAECYTDEPTDPLASPLYGELAGFPPSLIFSGGDEIMLDDARLLHQKLLAAGCRSEHIITPRMWHAYVLYGLREHKTRDMAKISSFLDSVMPFKRKLRWMRLDNAAKIYPAAKRKNWSNVFRLSMTLDEPIDPDILQSALDVTVRRFPSIAVRLRKGVFWYYLEELRRAPEVMQDSYSPLMHMNTETLQSCAFRVLYYGNRIAAEFFHALTDGNGGLIFLKSLTAEYLMQKHRIVIPAACGILDRLEEPTAEELEDSFLRYEGTAVASRSEPRAYRVGGTPEPDRFLHITTGTLDSSEVLSLARRCGVTVTAFLTAVMLESINEIQAEKVPNRLKRRPVKVQVPVNLRKLFPSKTLRNFAYYVSPGIDPREGDYTFEELTRIVSCQMALEVTPNRLRARITSNVRSEKQPILKIMPLFIKNMAMRAVFDTVGEAAASLCLSNLGVIELPEEMQSHVERADFIIGVQAQAPYNCGAVSYDGKLNISIVRNTEEPILEQKFFTRLRRLGLAVKIESNQR